VSGVALPGVRRCIEGRSGSSAGLVPVWVDAVVVVESAPGALSEERRFIVGLSGSSGGSDVPPFVDPELADVVDEPDEDEELSLRFIVGRSDSSLEAWLAVPDAVASGFPLDGLFVWPPGWVAPGLPWSLLLAFADAGSPLVFVTRCGRFGSVEDAVITGSVLDGFKAAAVFRGAARGLTLP
jgi:hypothetical protein